MMKRLGLALFLFAANAGASPATIEDLPFAPTAVTTTLEPISRSNAPYERQCVLTTANEHGIALRWIPGESAIERTTFSMYRKDENGHLEREDPQWSYEPIVRYESVNKVVPTKIAENGGVAVWAYREANAVVLVVPGKAGLTVTSGAQRGEASCAMATIVLSTKPESECKTTTGCGRMARASGMDWAVTAGVSHGAVSASVRLVTASK